jgi:hypothetical protein
MLNWFNHAKLVFTENSLFAIPILILCGTASVALTVAAVKTRAKYMYLVISVFIAVIIFFSAGHDTATHAFRSIILDESIESGAPNLMIKFNEASLPIFYYYSTVIYTLTVPLIHFGISAVHAINLIGVVSFSLMAIGFLRVAQRATLVTSDNRDSAFLVGAAFLSVNYVYLNYIGRGAISEALSFSIVPVAVLAILNRNCILSALLISFQIMVHPVIFIQSFVSEVAMLLILDKALVRGIFTTLLIYLMAVAISAPFWLPQFIHKGAIRGVEALPVKFEDTFLRLTSLIDPGAFASFGPWFVILFIIVFSISIRNATWQVKGCSAILIATILLQLQISEPWVVKLPILNLSLFVWRWMFVSAIIGATIIGVLWRERINHIALIIVYLSGMSVIITSARYTIPTGKSFVLTNSAIRDSQDNVVWGVSEFMPNYSSFPQDCSQKLNSESIRVPYSRLREAPLIVNGPIMITNGPIGIVTYLRDGEAVKDIVACDSSLVIPILHSNTTVEVRGDTILDNPWLKILLPIAVLLGILGVLLSRRGWPRHKASIQPGA